MTVRTILVSVDGSENSRVILDAALGVARRFDVHLDVLHVRPDPLAEVPAIGDGMTGSMADKISSKAGRQSAERAIAARTLFDDWSKAHGLTVVEADAEAPGLAVSWIERTGRKHKVMARLGRVHDLLVLGHPSDPKDLAHSLTVEALFDTGRPVLMVPANPVADFGKRIGVAWNGSRECARALGGATNFLKDAEQVVILTGQSERTPVSVVPELAVYLKRHGVSVTTRTVSHTGKEHLGGDALLAAAKAEGVDMLVMGAHQVNRIKQMVLGSATADILAKADIPVLMGH